MICVQHPGMDGRGPDVYYNLGESMLVTSKTYRHENKCMNCGKGSYSHRSGDSACPIGGSRNFPSFAENGMKFRDSGKPTLKSVRALNKLLDQENRTQEALERQTREQAKVRAMTFHEVVEEAARILKNFTGLNVEKENWVSNSNVELHLVANTTRLGFMSVTKYSDGSYGVAGNTSGCFMANGSNRDISNVCRQGFQELEEKANKEKV